LNEAISAPQPSVRLGANHGYLIDGDIARIHADVEILDTSLPASHWALQLWACESPHAGGPLSGVIVAEAAWHGGVDAAERLQRLDAEAHARVLGGQRDYAMVLVLASGENGQYEQVHDFANYPARQRFITPHLEGSVGYSVDGDQVMLEAGAVRSPRDADNLSGSLSLELWALADPYHGGHFAGLMLGRVDLGRLGGQSVLTAIAERAPFTAPSAGRWHVVMMLREWTGPAGYVTRDYARFAVPYVVGGVTPATPAAAESSAAQVEETIAKPLAMEAGRVDAEPTPNATAAAVPERVVKTVLPAPSITSPTVKTRTQRGVSVNKASAEELAAIKGLSRPLAREIVKGRPYQSLDALLDVRGIGVKLLARLRPHLTL
jgi:DNA uptake protein ComE-like DNA-binding protein